MKTTNTRRGRQAFTLNELCFVCAIIGIIAAFIFYPFINGALINAGTTRVGNIGRNIVLAIISANTEREAMRMGAVWPSTNACVNPQKPNHDYTTDSISESYFADLVGRNPDEGAVENLRWFVFSGAGIPAATTAAQFEYGGFNAWNYIAGLDEDAQDDTPFLITTNTKIDRQKLELFSAKIDSKLTDAEINALFGKGKPFGDVLMVFIQKGGGVQHMKGKYFRNPKQFLASSQFDKIHNPNAKVIGAANGELNRKK